MCAILWVEIMLMGEAGTCASSASVRSCGDDVDIDRLSTGRRLVSPSIALSISKLLLRAGGCEITVPSALKLSSSSDWTRTPLRFSLSDSRSSRSESVDEIDGNAPWWCKLRGADMLVDGGLERGRGCDGEYEVDIETRGDDEGVDAGVSLGVDGGEGLKAKGGCGRGCTRTSLARDRESDADRVAIALARAEASSRLGG